MKRCVFEWQCVSTITSSASILRSWEGESAGWKFSTTPRDSSARTMGSIPWGRYPARSNEEAPGESPREALTNTRRSISAIRSPYQCAGCACRKRERLFELQMHLHGSGFSTYRRWENRWFDDCSRGRRARTSRRAPREAHHVAWLYQDFVFL